MVRIRLRRVGARNQPSFRIVATDKRSPRDGRFLEILGHYNPRTEPATVSVDEARLFHWLSNGAQPTDAVRSALNALGTWDRWERFKAGEDIETLVQEAEASVPEVDPRTRREDFTRSRPSKKAKAKEAEDEGAEAAAPGETPDEAVPATEAPAEPEGESEPAAETEPDGEAEASAEPETAPESEAEASAEPESAPEAEGEDEPASEGEADSEAEPTDKSDESAGKDSAAEPEAEAEQQTEAESEAADDEEKDEAGDSDAKADEDADKGEAEADDKD